MDSTFFCFQMNANFSFLPIEFEPRGREPASLWEAEPEMLVDQGVSSLKGNCPTKTGIHIRQLFGSIRYQGNTTKQKGMDGIGWENHVIPVRSARQLLFSYRDHNPKHNKQNSGTNKTKDLSYTYFKRGKRENNANSGYPSSEKI